MIWQPHPYQIQTARRIILERRHMAFLHMGLGKTAIVLTAIDWLIKHNRIKSALVLAPIRVIYNSWPDEINKWNHLNHLTYSIIHGKNKQEKLAKHADIYLLNYEGIKWFFKEVVKHSPKKLKTSMIVFDESVKVKNTDTKRYRMLGWLKQYFPYRIAMTGTPAPNSILDIFGQYFLIDDGFRLGTSYNSFKKRYFVPIDHNEYTWVPKKNTIKTLASKVQDITTRVKSSDYVKLPEVITNNVEDILPSKLQSQYDELEEEFFLQIDEVGIEVFNAASLSTKLRQFLQGGLYYDQDKRKEWKQLHELKLDMIQEIKEDYDFPTLIAIQFRFERELIKERFPDAVVDITAKNSVQIKKAWNNKEIDLLAVHPVSMGEGLNLQYGGHVIIWAALPWSSDPYEQMNARILRQGQKNNVILHHLLFKNTIETRVLAALRSKISNQNKFLMYIRGDR